MQHENNREPTDAQKADMVLRSAFSGTAMSVRSGTRGYSARMWGVCGVGLTCVSLAILKLCVASGRYSEARCVVPVLCGGAAAVACSIIALRRGSFWWGLSLIPAAYLVIYVAFYSLVGDL